MVFTRANDTSIILDCVHWGKIWVLSREQLRLYRLFTAPKPLDSGRTKILKLLFKIQSIHPNIIIVAGRTTKLVQVVPLRRNSSVIATQ